MAKKEQRYATTPAFFEKLFDSFDRKLINLVDYTSKLLTHKISRLETKLERAENAMLRYVSETKIKHDQELGLAEILVHKEMRSKVLMSQWTNYFLANSDQEQLDPVTFTFCRYCLNICICYAEVDASYFLRANVHKQLVAFGNFNSELVSGPALMALAHLALHHPDMRQDIVLADALPMALRILVHSNSRPILINTCKMCASLALHFPNKSPIVNSGCLHTLLDLILGSHKDFLDETIQYYSICGVVNTVSGSDANRVLLIELNGVKPLLDCLQMTSRDDTILECIKALTNIAYCNPFAAGKILSMGGDVVLVEMLETTDMLKQVPIVFSGFSCLSNLCTSEATQTRVGGLPGLVENILRTLDNARDISLATESANLVLALVWNNVGNKSRLANKGACTSLVKRLIRHCQSKDEAQINCVERVGWALASILLLHASHDRMESIGGLEEVIRICKKYSNTRILAALGQVIAAMVPSPEALKRYHDEEYVAPIEKYPSLPILKKIKFQAFKHLDSPPEWIDKAVMTLSLPDDALARQPPWVKDEFVQRIVCSKEFTTLIEPDASVLQNVDFRGMIFSVY